MRIDEDRTAFLKDKAQRGQKITVWKILESIDKRHTISNRDKVCSPIHQKEYAPGFIESNRAGTCYPDKLEQVFSPPCIEIHRGIHVFLSWNNTLEYLADIQDSEEYSYSIFRCEANMDDFVAAGSCFLDENNVIPSAVFTKIYISETDWKKAIDGHFLLSPENKMISMSPKGGEKREQK